MTINPTQADKDLCGFLMQECMSFRVTNDGQLRTIFDYKKAEEAIAQHVQEAVKAGTEELIEAVKGLRSAQKAYISYCKWGEVCSGSVNKETKEELGQEVAKAADKVDEALGKEVK